MNKEAKIGREKFLELPAADIRKMVQDWQKPRVGIFVADGNRRLVMCQTRLSPKSDEFYTEYARFFVASIQECLNIFFDHGLETLFFPLFGPSLLLRKNKFQSITLPNAYNKIFQADEWFQFYNEKGIRVKTYGDMSQLEKIDVNRLDFTKGINQMVEKTASHDKHTLFFGFMSENIPGMEMPQLIIDFYKSNNRAPTLREMVEIYYGESIPSADFIVFSDKLSTRALPPLISSQHTQIYYLPVPGFLGLNTTTFRKVLYDLLFLHPQDSIPEYNDNHLESIETLDKFYQQHKNTIIGIKKNPGNFMQMDL
jgi:hypothetical protein